MSERHLTQIGKYEVECVIGEGSMGVVYRAVDPLINRRVAIKVMADSVAQDVALRDRFLREAQTAGSLQHPNVVTIYDFGEVDDHLFIAMEYVEGNDLADLLVKNVSIPILDALDLTIGLLHGLAYAHKRGIIHRDIKPANIRVDTEGKARLMDFGVAHLASSDLTSTGMLLGTPAYMAPEQITGGSVTAETDIFSVGAVLYELLAGRRPFVGDTLQALMYSILNKSPESLEAIVPKMPAGLHDVVMRALKKESSQRYHSAMAMANDLAAIRDAIDPEGKRTSLSLRAAIDTALARETRATDRRRREWQVAAFAGGVLVAAALFVGARMVLSRIPSATTGAAAASLGSAPSAIVNAAPARATKAPESAAPTTAATPNVAAAPPAPLLTPRTTPSTSTTQSQRPTKETGARANTPASAPPSLTTASPKRPDSAVVVTAPPQRLPASSPATAPVLTQQQSSTNVPVPPAVAASPAATAAPAPRENVADQVANIIAAYARALESLDANELRRVYPSISAEQRSAFSDFFRSVRTLKATLSVAALQVDGASAEAQVTGAFDYITTSGATERRDVNFKATLRREKSGWTLAAVH